MGRDNHNAGLHFVRSRWATNDSFSGYSDRYAEIINEAHYSKQKQKEDEKKLLQDIEICNFIILCEKRGTVSTCRCGGKFDYKDNIIVRYHGPKNMMAVKIAGKVCRDCERKLIIKSIVLNAISANEGFDVKRLRDRRR